MQLWTKGAWVADISPTLWRKSSAIEPRLRKTVPQHPRMIAELTTLQSRFLQGLISAVTNHDRHEPIPQLSQLALAYRNGKLRAIRDRFPPEEYGRLVEAIRAGACEKCLASGCRSHSSSSSCGMAARRR